MKRLGYLLVTMCIKTDSKFSILLLSSIQKDLASDNLHHVVVCLTALPKIMNNLIVEACL
jgi:AP-4 complex subunit epsilon-1